MRISTLLVATCASLVGLFASGEWTSLNEEMKSFGNGGFAYVVTLFSIVQPWQVSCVSTGLVFLVASSLRECNQYPVFGCNSNCFCDCVS